MNVKGTVIRGAGKQLVGNRGAPFGAPTSTTPSCTIGFSYKHNIYTLLNSKWSQENPLQFGVNVTWYC